MSGTGIHCPRCDEELVWQNDYDLGLEDDDETYTDYLCHGCGVSVTVPWSIQNQHAESI